MIDLSEKVKRIRFESERQFASTFFDHAEWTYQPGPFYLGNGTRYSPDFHDLRRDVLIEVTNTKGSFRRNEKKYKMFVTQYPSMKLEFRYHTGQPIRAVDRGDRFTLPAPIFGSRPSIIRDHQYDLRAIMPELRNFFIKTRWEYTSLKRYIGLDIQPVRFALTRERPYCKEPLFRAVKEMLSEFAEHPEHFPVCQEKNSYSANSAKTYRDFDLHYYPMAKTELPGDAA